jgi:hypothetical protein
MRISTTQWAVTEYMYDVEFENAPFYRMLGKPYTNHYDASMAMQTLRNHAVPNTARVTIKKRA